MTGYITPAPLNLLPCPICGKIPTIRLLRKVECIIECGQNEKPPYHRVCVHGVGVDHGRVQAITEWNDRNEPLVNSEKLPEWVKSIIECRIGQLQELVDATDYDDNKYAWNFAIEELQDVISIKKEV